MTSADNWRETLRSEHEKYIALLLGESLDVVVCDEIPSSEMVLNGRRYRERATEQMVFYDWIANLGGAIVALEIHVSIDDPIFDSKPPLVKLKYIECRPFPRMWLSTTRTGFELGLEAFGDIYFFNSDDNQLAIIVAANGWIRQNRFL